MCNVALEKPCFYVGFVGGMMVLAKPATGQRISRANGSTGIDNLLRILLVCK